MNLPNKLTVSRFVMTAAFVTAMAVGKEWEEIHAPGRETGWSFAYTAALLLFIAASVTDYLDGHFARKLGVVTSFGKLMDPLADKVMIAAAFICLVPLKGIPAWVVIVIISREFLITGLRLLAAGRGVILQSERLGKHKAFWQIVTAGYFLLLLALMEWERAGWISMHLAGWPACFTPAFLKLSDALGGTMLGPWAESVSHAGWWFGAWRYGGWALAAVTLVLTLYSGIGYLRKHRDLLAE
jgi:CDP-diacylglycerol---glycerol-3-phosphate 3-phosphatidyltransferase